jgi:sigma-54 dependent transcriptional regulator, acetoin dehydrogenase operon transcriptional activator AcoR
VLTRALLQRAAAHRGQPMSLGDVQAVLPAAPPHAPASRLQQGADELVRSAYERCGHSLSQTARTLAVSRSTVNRYLRGGGGVNG